MQVTVHLRPGVSKNMNLAEGRDPVSRMLLAVAKELGVELRPLAPARDTKGTEALSSIILVQAPDNETAQRVVARFRQLPVTDMVYLKPEALPAVLG